MGGPPRVSEPGGSSPGGAPPWRALIGTPAAAVAGEGGTRDGRPSCPARPTPARAPHLPPGKAGGHRERGEGRGEEQRREWGGLGARRSFATAAAAAPGVPGALARARDTPSSALGRKTPLFLLSDTHPPIYPPTNLGKGRSQCARDICAPVWMYSACGHVCVCECICVV